MDYRGPFVWINKLFETLVDARLAAVQILSGLATVLVLIFCLLQAAMPEIAAHRVGLAAGAAATFILHAYWDVAVRRALRRAEEKCRRLSAFNQELVDTDASIQRDLVEGAKELNRKLLRLCGLVEASRDLLFIGEVNEVFQKVADLIRRAMGASCAVVEVNPGFIESGEPKVFSSGALRDGVTGPSDSSDEPEASKMMFKLSVPLVIRGETVGTVSVYNRSVNSQVRDDMSLLSILGTYASIAIENTRLFVKSSESSAQLAALKEYAENLVESVPVGVLALDADLGVVTFNSVMERITGLNRDEVIGRKVSDALAGFAGPELIELVGSVFGKGRPSELHNVEYTDTSGKRLVLRLQLSPLRNFDSSITGIVIVVEDVTEKVRLGEQMRQFERIKVVGEFAAGVAHEINNPIGIICASAEHLQARVMREHPEDAHTLRALKVIEEEANRCSTTVKNLLVFARASSFNPVRLDVRGLVEETVDFARPRAAAQGVEIRLKLGPDGGGETFAAGGGDGGYAMLGDPSQLRQVFINIILNALEAMPHGGILDVWVARTQRPYRPEGMVYGTDLDGMRARRMLEIGFRDTGGGIDPADLPKLFNPFFTTKPDGTGLGLSISLGIVENHGGSIVVDSRPGKGATFVVVLPLTNPNFEPRRRLRLSGRKSFRLGGKKLPKLALRRS